MSEAIEKMIERYEEEIEKRDEKISELERQVETLEWWTKSTDVAWCRPLEAEESDLPVPRLEIRLTVENEWSHHWMYTMVYRHTRAN